MLLHSTTLIMLLTVTMAQTPSTKCNGYTEYCAKSLNKLAFPFTHNSYAYMKADSKSIPPQANQDPGWTLDLQLRDGVRAFEFDIVVKNSSTGASLELCHDTCDGFIGLQGPSLAAAASTFVTFLNANPREVVVIVIENVSKSTATAIAASLGSAFAALAYTPTPSFQWPTLTDLISANKRIVMFTDVNADPAVPWIIDANDYLSFSEYAIFTDGGLKQCDNKGTAAIPSATLYRMNHMLSTAISTSIYYPNTVALVSSTNTAASLNSHLAICKAANKQVNFVCVDYGRTGDLFAVVASYNGVAYSGGVLPDIAGASTLSALVSVADGSAAGPGKKSHGVGMRAWGDLCALGLIATLVFFSFN